MPAISPSSDVFDRRAGFTAMRLTFAGTRANVDVRTDRHRRHSSLLLQAGRGVVMIDCGEDWACEVDRIAPDAILLTHAHPDHAGGLRDGAPCRVFATADTWRLIDRFPIDSRTTIALREPFAVEGIEVEAFAVEHSIRAPAIGYRLASRGVSLFYVPDVVSIPERGAALRGCRLYVGDGATLTRPMVRRRGGALFGHTTVRAQLGWCQKEGVPRAVFTHCGAAVVSGDEQSLSAQLQQLGRERGVEACFAHDGLVLEL